MLPEATSKLRLSDERGEAASDGQGSSQTPMLDTASKARIGSEFSHLRHVNI